MTSAIGIDIGKTNITVGVVEANGGLVEMISEHTDHANGSKSIINQCMRIVATIINAHPTPKAIGLGSFGVVDHSSGVIVGSGSIPHWQNIPIRDLLHRRFGLLVQVDNDVNVAALGEKMSGAGRGADTALFLTISTGIGFSYVQQEKVHRGANGQAGQIAHIPIFGATETLNEYASGSGIAARASRETGQALTTREVFERASDGDPVCSCVITEAIDAIATLLAWIQQFIDPQVIIVGGGVVLARHGILAEIEAGAREKLARYPRHLKVVAPALGANAGVVGAALLALKGDT